MSGAAPIHVVGVDGSGPAGLAPGVLELVHGARLLCGGRRQLALFPEIGGERFSITADLEALYRRLEAEPGVAVVLASGDPGFFGVGPLLADRLGRDRVVIHPAPSSVALAFARLGVAWQDATVLSAHGRPVEAILTAALQAEKVAVLTDPEHTPAVIGEALLAAGMPDCPAFVCERLGEPGERVHAVRLSELPLRCFEPLNVLVLLAGSQAAQRDAFGRGEDAYDSLRGQITKAEVRAVTLAKLEPWRAAVCWDVGAGAGSVSIEAAGLMRGGAIYAVERDLEQLQVLRANLRRHHSGLVHVIGASVPEALAPLPDPDAVFIGGAGSALDATLRVAASRLRPGGRLVANFTLFESLTCWQDFAAALGWPSEVCQISVARGKSLAGGTHLAPLAPVFVTRLVRPDGPR